jgi:hypothetical protein
MPIEAAADLARIAISGLRLAYKPMPAQAATNRPRMGIASIHIGEQEALLQPLEWGSPPSLVRFFDADQRSVLAARSQDCPT